eukprot:scaffold297_cov171-Amphora_coffeaeformis.AAC.9
MDGPHFDKLTLLTMEESVFDELIDNFREEDEIFFALDEDDENAILTSRGADTAQLYKLGKALLRSGLKKIGEFELEGGSFCQKGTTPAAVEDLCSFFQLDHVVVDSLKLQAEEFEDDVQHEIPCRLMEAFAKNGTPEKTLRLEGFDLTQLSPGLAHLMESGTLKRLDVEGCNVSDVNEYDVTLMQEALQTQRKGLQEVFVREQMSSRPLRSFLSGLVGNPSLQRVHLESCEISKSNMYVFAQLLDTTPSLQRMEYRPEEITTSMLESLASTLQGTSTLECLELSGSGLRAKHVGALAKVIAKLPKLLELHLRSNLLGEKGVHDICQVLCYHRSIHTVSLNDNNLIYENNDGGDGSSQRIWKHLVELFRHNQCLKCLHLDTESLAGCQEEIWQAFLQGENPELALHCSFGTWTKYDPLTCLRQTAFADGWAMSLSCKRNAVSETISLDMVKTVSGRNRTRTVSVKVDRPTSDIYGNWIWNTLKLNYSYLTSLEISADSFHPDHLKSILEASMSKESHFRKLALYKPWNSASIQPIAIKTLCRLLPEARSLESLELFISDNLNDKWVHSLKTAFATNQSLTHVNISGHRDYARLLTTDSYALRNRMSNIPPEAFPLADRIATTKVPTSRHESWSALERRLETGFWAAKLLVHRPFSNKRKRNH